MSFLVPPFTKGEVYPLGERWYLSSWMEKANLPSEEILRQKGYCFIYNAQAFASCAIYCISSRHIKAILSIRLTIGGIPVICRTR